MKKRDRRMGKGLSWPTVAVRRQNWDD
jgi:hypothetical protein